MSCARARLSVFHSRRYHTCDVSFERQGVLESIDVGSAFTHFGEQLHP